MKKTNWPLYVVTGIILLLFGIFIFLLFHFKIFDFTGSEANAKIIASVLALIGGLFASIVSIIGILLRHSLDQRNLDLLEQSEKRLELEAKRNEELKKESESRLKIETAIRAVQSLSTSSGTDVSGTQRAGVLFALSYLGLNELTLNLLCQMVPEKKVDPETTSWILNTIFESANINNQIQAATLLRTHPYILLLDNGGVSLPPVLAFNWNTNLSFGVRIHCAFALLKILIFRSRSKWEIGALNALVATLISIWRKEADPIIKNSIGLNLTKILNIYSDNQELILPSRDLIKMGAIKKELGEVIAFSGFENEAKDIFDKLDKWVGE